MADVRDASDPPRLVAPRPVLGEVARNGVSMGTGPRWCHLDAADNVSAALGSLSRSVPHRLAYGRRIFGCDVRTVPASGASRRGRLAGGLEAAPRDLGHRGGVTIDRHER